MVSLAFGVARRLLPKFCVRAVPDRLCLSVVAESASSQKRARDDAASFARDRKDRTSLISDAQMELISEIQTEHRADSARVVNPFWAKKWILPFLEAKNPRNTRFLLASCIFESRFAAETADSTALCKSRVK